MVEDLQKDKDKGLLSCREVVQSYIITAAKRRYSLYAERILMKIVEAAQGSIKGMNFVTGRDIKKHSCGLNIGFNESQLEKEESLSFVGRNAVGDAVLQFPISEFLTTSGSKNYNIVREALKELQQEILYWENYVYDIDGNKVFDKKGRPIKEWTQVQLVGRVNGVVRRGFLVMKIDSCVWDVLVDMSMGFKAYDLNIAMILKRSCSIRLYQLVSRQKSPLTFGYEDFKSRLGMEKRYARTIDFERRVLKPAKEELDAVAPYSFDYEISKECDFTGKKVSKIRIYPKYSPVRDASLKKGSKLAIEPSVLSYLRREFGLNWIDIEPIRNILFVADRVYGETGTDLITLLEKLKPYVTRAENQVGYLRKVLLSQLGEMGVNIYQILE